MSHIEDVLNMDRESLLALVSEPFLFRYNVDVYVRCEVLLCCTGKKLGLPVE